MSERGTSLNQQGLRPVFRRLAFGIGANALGKVWVIGAQLVTVPVATLSWGAAGYGQWLMLTTVPAYLAVSSVGFANAAIVEMTRRFAIQDRAGVLAVFQSVWILVSIGILAVISMAVMAGLTGSTLFESWSSTLTHYWVGLVAMCFYAFAAVQISIVGAGFRATNRYAHGTALSEGILPLEAMAITAVCLCGGGINAAAVAVSLVRIFAAAAYYAILRRQESWLRLGVASANVRQIRSLLKPALSAFSMNLSSAFALQGVVLAIGAAISPAAAGAFGAARLVSRVPLQVIAMGSRASAPELTRLHAQKDSYSRDRLFMINVAVAFFVAIPAAILLVLLGPSVVEIVSHGRLQVSTALFVALATAMAIQSIWMVGADFLWAINRQGVTAYVYVLTTGAMVAGPFLVQNPHALEKAASLLVLGELTMFIAVAVVCSRESSITVSLFMAAALDFFRRLKRLTSPGER